MLRGHRCVPALPRLAARLRGLREHPAVDCLLEYTHGVRHMLLGLTGTGVGIAAATPAEAPTATARAPARGEGAARGGARIRGEGRRGGGEEGGAARILGEQVDREAAA